MKTIRKLFAVLRGAIKGASTGFLAARLRLVEFRIALLWDTRAGIDAALFSSNRKDTIRLLKARDRNGADINAARNKEMRLALQLEGLRQVHLPHTPQPRPTLRIVKP